MYTHIWLLFVLTVTVLSAEVGKAREAQIKQWAAFERQWDGTVATCGTEFTSDQRLAFSGSRETFQEYLNTNDRWLTRLEREVPHALQSGRCASFLQSYHLVIHESNTITNDINSVIDRLANDLVPPATQELILESSMCSTEQYIENVQMVTANVVNSLTSWPWSIWKGDHSAETLDNVYQVYGIPMLRQRACVYELQALNGEVKKLSQSFVDTLQLHESIIEISLTASMGWDLETHKQSTTQIANRPTPPQCPSWQLEKMRKYCMDVLSRATSKSRVDIEDTCRLPTTV